MHQQDREWAALQDDNKKVQCEMVEQQDLQHWLTFQSLPAPHLAQAHGLVVHGDGAVVNLAEVQDVSQDAQQGVA